MNDVAPTTDSLVGEEALRVLLDAAPEAVLMVAADGRIVHANAAASRLYQYAPDELEGMAVERLVPEALRHRHATQREGFHAQPTARPMGHANRLVVARRKDGTELAVEVTLAPTRGAQGPLVVVFVVDISKRVRAESALHAIDEQYRAVLTNTNEGVIVVDPSGRYLFLNDRMAEMLGCTVEDALGKTSADFGFEHDELTRARAAVRGGATAGELTLHRVDGSVRRFRYRAAPIFDESGRHIANVGLHTDVTDSLLATEALGASEERYHKLIDQMSDGLYVASAEGRYVDVNAAACEQFGMTREELLGCSLQDLLAPEELPRLTGKITSLADGKVQRDEWRFRRKDGSVFIGELSGRRLPDGRFQGVVRDVTERKAAERTILDYQEALRSMAFDAIVEEDRERRRLAGNLHDGAGQTLALAQLKLSQVRANADPAIRSELEACERLLREADAQIRSLTFDLSPPVLYDLGLVPALEWLGEQMSARYHLEVRLEGDRQLELLPEAAAVLFRTIRELLLNVAKHANSPGALVRVRQGERELAIGVHDRGAGFDPSDRARTAGRFGLFGIREQIQRLGGRVEIASAPAEGTSVTVVVPLGRAMPKGEAAS